MNDNSEFMCQTVAITAVRPHPGADRLDLATFWTGTAAFPYEIVVGKEEFKFGDVAVYIAPDAEVPLSGQFEFLNKRLDAKDKTRYHIRSARIRGLFSPGLLIPWGADADVGVDVSSQLDVIPWIPGDERIKLEKQEAHEARRKALPLPNRFPVYDVTSLKKVPYLFEEGEQVSITEKIHGTNFRFGYGGHSRFFYGTHRTTLADTRGLFRRIADFFRGRKYAINTSPGYGNPWREAVEKFALDESAKIYPDYVFYGELFGVTGSGRGVQDLTYGQSELSLRIFDIYFPRERRWLTNEDRGVVLAALNWAAGYRPVVEIYRGGYHLDIARQMAEADSTFGGIREGVVVEALEGNRRKGKWVSERYHTRKL